jgi:hypothetical protein
MWLVFNWHTIKLHDGIFKMRQWAFGVRKKIFSPNYRIFSYKNKKFNLLAPPPPPPPGRRRRSGFRRRLLFLLSTLFTFALLIER